MRILIAGCGYVGLPLGIELARQGHAVYGLRRTDATDAQLQAGGLVPLHGDVTRPETLAELPVGYDWVIHCVASSGGDAGDYRRVYLEGTRNLLAWLAPEPPAKFLYTSSTSVYGQTNGSVVTETSPTQPAASSAQVLVETEEFLRRAARERGFPAIILRLAGIYGPSRGYWLKQFLNGEAAIEGDGGRVLNMIHRDDVVGAILAALQRGQPGQTYNVADDEPVTQLALFQWLSAALGRGLPPLVPEDPATYRKRGVTNKRVSNHKLRSELVYQFKYPTFRQGYMAELQLQGGITR